jgi:ubiquinone/menaquinone biosynthesis C-methylase UbiE
MTDGAPALDEEQRLRSAYARRGPVEVKLAGNRGQAMIVAERDRSLRAAVRALPTPATQLLEIGCGDGPIVSALVAEGFAAKGFGLDILPEAIEQGRRNHPELELHAGNATALPFEAGRFDVVLASTLLSSVPPGEIRRAVMAEVDRVLRPGGIFVWYDMRRRNPFNKDVQPFLRSEMQAALAGYDIHLRTLTVVPQIARRLGPLTRIGYPLLALLPILRTHSCGWARKPGA